MTMPGRIVSLVAGASLLFTAVAWAETVTDRIDRFMLFDSCRPMYLLVERLPEDATEIGLKEEDITTTVRSRLRAARLYSEDLLVGPYLYVSVNVVGPAYAILLQYNKWVNDAVSGETGHATTWESGSVGTHGQDSGYILSSVSRHMDMFIDEYLRVNESACQR